MDIPVGSAGASKFSHDFVGLLCAATDPRSAHAAMASSTSLRSPAPPAAQSSSPLNSRRDDSGTATPSWSKGRPLSVSNPPALTDEGAAQLSTRRRQSSSFKTMTTGSLVSNSPFARLGTVTSPPMPNRGSLYSTQRTPVVPVASTSASSANSASDSAQRKTSGGRSTIPDERDPLPKENRRASGEQPAGSVNGGDDQKGSKEYTPVVLAPRAFGSPAVPFRPVRPQSSVNNPAASRLAPDHEPAQRGSDSASERHDTSPSAYTSPSRPLPTAPRLSPNPSPYGIGSLAKESPQLHDYPLNESETEDESPVRAVKHKTSASMIGLGVRPSPVPGDRRIIAGASAPPPATPPQDRQRTPSQSGSPSPSSALSPSRRGIRGPRAPLDADTGSDTEKEDDDAAEHRRVLRRQASTKTVRWAETEEVLEFEVEEERRRSQASNSSSSDGDRSYDNDHDDGNSSLGFEEGGSVEVHDIDDSYGSEDDASAVSSGSGVEDLVDTIDSFMAEDEFRTDAGDVFGEDRGSYGGRKLTYDDQQHHHPPAPQSAFSSSSASTASSGTRDDDTTSDSSYDDDEELAQATKAHSALDQVELTFQLTSPPTSPPVPSSQPASSFNLATPKPYALPDLPDNSPFLGFADDGGASSVVSMDLARSSVPTTEPLMSPRIPATSTPTRATPTKSTASPGADFSPILSAFADYSEPPAPLSREVSLVGSDYRASLRGGRLAAGKEAFEEKLRRQQAILESFDSRPTALAQPSSRAVTAPQPATSSPHLTDVSIMSPPLASFPDPPRLAIPPSSKAIPARPALRTASNSNLRASSPPVATSSMQFGMDSPLERLGREVEGGQQGWSGVQPSVSMASVASNDSAMAVREREIIERKRSLKEKNGRTRPRRSLSTGDVPQMTARTDGIDSVRLCSHCRTCVRADSHRFADPDGEASDHARVRRTRQPRTHPDRGRPVVHVWRGERARRRLPPTQLRELLLP